MKLPTLEIPSFNIVIPSTGKSISIRPYLVKEEKILMLARESNDEKAILNAIKNIVRACSFNNLDPNQLTMTDLEYVFLKIRAVSVGETAQIKITCNCGNPVEVDVDLNSIEVVTPQAASNKIEISKTLGLTLRPITLQILDRFGIASDKSEVDTLLKIVMASIDTIYDGATIFKADEAKVDELEKFIEQLSSQQMTQISKWIETLPKLQKEVKCVCPKCKVESSTILSGIKSFFS